MLRERAWLDILFVPLAVLILCVYLAIASPVFLTQGNIDNLLAQMVILAIVAFGATFVILVRGLDLSVGAGVAMVSVVTAYVMVETESVPLGIVAGVVTGMLIGVINGFLVAVLEVPAFIATLGMLVILRGIALAITDGGVISGLPASFNELAFGNFVGLQWIVWLMVLTFVALYVVQRQTRFGMQVYAVGGNPNAARLSGIPVRWVYFLCFVISGTTISLAGLALTARVQSGQPNGANLLELFAIAAIVLGGTSLFGGRGSVPRTLSGVLLIVILQNGLDLQDVNYDLQQAIIGIVFIGAATVDFVRRHARRRSTLLETRQTTETTSANEAPQGEPGIEDAADAQRRVTDKIQRTR